MRRLSILAQAALLVAFSASASAEPAPSLDFRRFRPSTDPAATLFLEPTSTPGPGAFNGAAWISWARRPFTLSRDGATVAAVVRDQASLDVALNIGIGKRLALGLVAPMVLEQKGDSTADTTAALGGRSLPAQAFGDVALVAKGVLVPTNDLGGFGLALVDRLSLPTGNRTSTVGEGAASDELRLLAEYRLVGLAFLASSGFELRGAERTVGTKTWGDELPWAVGVTLRPQMLGWDTKGHWTWGVEAHGWLPAGPSAPFTDAALTGAYVGASARYASGDFGLLLGAESGVTHSAGSAPVHVALAFTWAPREHDQDHDGVPDDRDECIGLAEDHDGFQDDDGCPEMDNDDDGVLDPDDKCPNVPEDQDDFEDEDGCPDPDNDKDGIPDQLDACPNEAGPASPDPKTNGCPHRETDADKDKVHGANDQCPDQPEDVDGFEDEDGCPDPDNDKDGVADAEDACPNEKGQKSADPRKNGCPNPDIDGDGIPNDTDKCPNDPETYNGFEDEDGCPEPDTKRHPLLAAIVTKKGAPSLEVRGKIGFVGDVLDASGTATLRAVAVALRGHPEWHVEVAVRPSPKVSDDALRARASAVVEVIQKTTGRPDAAVVVAWQKGKPPWAEVSGVSIVLVVRGGT